MDGVYLPAALLFIDMDLVADGEDLRLYVIAGVAPFIVDIVGITPGKHTLFDA
jgi:hypothetical protein